MKHLILSLILVAGCTSAQVQTIETDLATAKAAALAFVQKAESDPTALAALKAFLSALAAKADPKQAPEVQKALDQVNAGNLAAAEALLK